LAEISCNPVLGRQGGAPRPTLILWIVTLEIENGDRQR
jgi:hypothetical protein